MEQPAASFAYGTKDLTREVRDEPQVFPVLVLAVLMPVLGAGGGGGNIPE